MAQHDYAIANGSGSAVRSDLNNALAAIVSHNSGTSEPTTTYAYMPWADTSAGVMKLRNGANNAWITLYQLDGEYTTIPLEDGTAAAPSLYFKTSGTDTGLYSPGADQVAISTAGTGRLFVGSDGKVGIGTSSPGAFFHVNGSSSGRIALFGTGTVYQDIALSGTTDAGNGTIVISPWTLPGSGTAEFYTYFKKAVSGVSTTNHNVIIDGKVGIGTTSVGAKFHIDDASTGALIRISSGTNGSARGVEWYNNNTANVYGSITSDYTSGVFTYDAGRSVYAGIHAFRIGTGGEAARIDGSGRLLVGTTSPLITYNLSASGGAYGPLQVVAKSTGEANSLLATFQSLGLGHQLSFATSRGPSVGTPVQSGDTLGRIAFFGDDGSTINSAGASIHCAVDATPGVGDMPGRLVFSTTADGASSPTERLRISNNGQLSTVVPGGSTLYPGFMARAWVNFDGTGTVAIRASGNVSSITDNGAGDYTVNFTTAMPDANYAVTQAYTPSSSATYVAQVSTMTASSVRMGSYLDFSNGTNLDQSMVSVAIFR